MSLTPDEYPASSGSVLDTLRQEREAKLAGLWIDLRVPRYDTPLYVRFKPITSPALARLMARAEEGSKRSDDAQFYGHIGVLAETVVGVFVKNANGECVSPLDGSLDNLPKFEASLADGMGIPHDGSVASIIKKFYLADGDIFRVSQAIQDFSGFSADPLEAEPGK